MDSWKRKGCESEIQPGVIPTLNSIPPLPLYGPVFYFLLRAVKMNEQWATTLQVRRPGGKGNVLRRIDVDVV